MRIRPKMQCLLSTIRWQTNVHLTNYRYAVVNMKNCSYPELTPTFMRIRHGIRCLLSTIRWKTNGYLTIYRVGVTDITNCSYPELTASFIRARHKIRCLLNTVSWQTNVHLINYRVAVGPLVGQGCDRSELPCLADGITQQGRRSWSFYMYDTCCLLDRQICGQMLLTNDIVFGHWFTSNR